MDVTGKLKKKLDPQTFGSGFRKQDFVLEIQDGNFPQFVSFTAVKDKIEDLENYEIGDDVKVNFNLRGREWTSPSGEVKYFNTLEVWKFESAEGGSGGGRGGYSGGNAGGARNGGGNNYNGGGNARAASTPGPASESMDTGDAGDDLPF